MCGICGIVMQDSRARIDRHQLLTMRETLTHRGPDDAGFYLDHGIGLAHRRLSIIDPSPRGRQPMQSASRRYCVTYNGEIYNFRSLRKVDDAFDWFDLNLAVRARLRQIEGELGPGDNRTVSWRDL